jgi:hypothetical protein
MLSGRILQRIEQFSLRRYTLVFGVAAALALASAWLGSRLRLDTDILSMLPENNRIISVFRRSVRDFGSLDYFLVLVQAPEDGPVAAGGSSAEDYEEFADELASDRQPTGIEYVEYRFDENSPILGHRGERSSVPGPDGSTRSDRSSRMKRSAAASPTCARGSPLSPPSWSSCRRRSILWASRPFSSNRR